MRNGVASMATLIVLSVGTDYLFNIGATFFYKGEVFLLEDGIGAAGHPAGALAGDARPRGRIDAIRALMDLAPPMATVVRNGVEPGPPTAGLQPGELVMIKPGDEVWMARSSRARRKWTSRC